MGIRARRTGASGVSGTISERGFRAKKHKENAGGGGGWEGARLRDKTADAMAAANLVPPPPPQPLSSLFLLRFLLHLFLLLSALVSFFSAALSSFPAVVPPEGFKNNSVNCIPVRRETEKSG